MKVVRKKGANMKILIMTDLEGVAGVCDFETQTYPTGTYYQKAKELLTEEVNASCKGALKSGVKEILVVDGHGSGGIIPEKICPEVFLLHGRPIPKFWNFDKGWDAIFLLAHHSMNGTENGNLNHTYSSKSIVNMFLNGEKIGEIGMNIYLAGWFGVPVILITGDQSACIEAEKYVNNIEKCVVKWGINRTCAISLSPEKSKQLIEEKSFNAIKRIKEIKPVKLNGKCELIIEFLSSSDAFSFAQRQYVEKIEPTKVKIKGENFIEMWSRWM